MAEEGLLTSLVPKVIPKPQNAGQGQGGGRPSFPRELPCFHCSSPVIPNSPKYAYIFTYIPQIPESFFFDQRMEVLDLLCIYLCIFLQFQNVGAQSYRNFIPRDNFKPQTPNPKPKTQNHEQVRSQLVDITCSRGASASQHDRRALLENSAEDLDLVRKSVCAGFMSHAARFEGFEKAEDAVPTTPGPGGGTGYDPSKKSLSATLKWVMRNQFNPHDISA